MELFPDLAPQNNLQNPEGLADRNIPLAERMRPRTIDEFVGQEHILESGKPLRRLLEAGKPVSMILWGPPGTGKTTLARLIATYAKSKFVEYSAVLSGIPQIREVIRTAEIGRQRGQGTTILFIDEIHRFNKAQQDAFLPHIEKGTIILIGATTENPSFEVIPALLSRTKVFTLKSLDQNSISRIIQRAIADEPNGMADMKPVLNEDAMEFLAEFSGGDARVALNVLEMTIKLAEPDSTGKRMIDTQQIARTIQKKPVIYDKSGEYHFAAISAFHKSLRGSDPDAALYWLARMIQGGEDPLYIARRMVRFATEDIGLADPQALSIALSAKETYHFLGSPEGDLALAECAIYLACSPKSNSVYKAWSKVRETASNTSELPVPLTIQNAPTRLMKELGYGKDYVYDHETTHHYSGQNYLPPEIAGNVFFVPGPYGFEREIRKRLDWWASLKNKIHRDPEKI